MRMTPVSSSDLSAVGYDEPTSTLRIEFHSGGTYDYSSVPLAVYIELMAANSQGRYFNQNIKQRYSYAKVF